MPGDWYPWNSGSSIRRVQYDWDAQHNSTCIPQGCSSVCCWSFRKLWLQSCPASISLSLNQTSICKQAPHYRMQQDWSSAYWDTSRIWCPSVARDEEGGCQGWGWACWWCPSWWGRLSVDNEYNDWGGCYCCQECCVWEATTAACRGEDEVQEDQWLLKSDPCCCATTKRPERAASVHSSGCPWCQGCWSQGFGKEEVGEGFGKWKWGCRYDHSILIKSAMHKLLLGEKLHLGESFIDGIGTQLI